MTAVIGFDVREKEWPEDDTKIHSNRDEVNQILTLIRLTLNQNEVRFSGKTGKMALPEIQQQFPSQRDDQNSQSLA